MATDTNLLVRALMDDDQKQSAIARNEIETAQLVVISTIALCELAWVLSRGYHVFPARIAEGIRRLIDIVNIVADWGAVDAGVAQLDNGDDFADGAIAYDARRMGPNEFVLFDRKAVSSLKARGEAPRLL